MPTPFGSRGGMAFSAAELRVLRRSLAHALQSSAGPLTAAEVQDCLRLAQAVDDAADEAGRLRAFLLEDLRRYREALPGSLGGYLELLRNALDDGYEPEADDLAALRALRGNPAAAALLERAQVVAERSLRRRLRPPAPRTRLLALTGGKAEKAERVEKGDKAEKGDKVENAEKGDEGEKGEGGGGEEPAPGAKPGVERPIPTPGEVFPPRRKPTPPPAAARVAG
ncbi:hypothetical protein [Streptomyces sp. NPDC051211]|uniref:hypothetical protein n=1 Tax=Streptomyces sp. NPDC051211 TaxID=3154643 RepID=UPI00344E707A